jgi:hypothetical protein
MQEPTRSPLVRTAAAVALLRRAVDREALQFLCDVILAATPYGRARGLALGLPVDRPRWALERHLAIEALEQATGRTLPLDADASWPALAAGVAAARSHLGLRQP